jgi:hypothetical protein
MRDTGYSNGDDRLVTGLWGQLPVVVLPYKLYWLGYASNNSYLIFLFPLIMKKEEACCHITYQVPITGLSLS